MHIITSPTAMEEWRAEKNAKKASVGFVPTMGFLHQGHASLIEESIANNAHTVVSIFVNPTQFTQSDDFEKYPRDFEGDASTLRSLAVDVLYMPSASEMYPDGFDTTVDPGEIATILEGKSRPGHFNGVATVVLKLLNTVTPQNAYFGKKDRQQLAVIRQVVQDLGLSVNIIGCNTVRSEEGLALSSRNARLTPEQSFAARVLSTALREMCESYRQGERNASALLSVGQRVLNSEPMCATDYLVLVDAVTMKTVQSPTDSSVICVAGVFGSIRLIDNTDLRQFV